jgi:hypothetical protein
MTADESSDWYLEVFRFSDAGAPVPLACYGPFSRDKADTLLVEYNTTVLAMLENADGLTHGSYCCGIVNRKRLEVMVRPDFHFFSQAEKR